MRDAVIVEAVRTPIGKRNGKLAAWHPVDLLAHTLRALIARSGIDPALVEDVITGCYSQLGEQGMNIGRNAVLAAGFPVSVPATTVDRQCGSSQQAVHFAAQGVMAGAYDIVIACGVESMSRVPMGSNAVSPGTPGSPFLHERFEGGLIPQGVSAELIAEKWALTRAAVDALSLESHRRAAAAIDAGRYAREIVPVPLGGGQPDMTIDEGVRRDTSLEKLATLKTVFKADGLVTAGNASQISDGAAAVLVMSREAAARLGLRPRARLVQFAVCGDDPTLMLTAPIPATRRVLARAGLKLEQIDRIEINEAFATVVLAWQRELDADFARVNVNGGAIAMGHPLGCSGARLMTTLLHELERSGGRYGLQTMCEYAGMANATIIERLD
ncbi:MAG: thiolase family protein [Thermoflexales bacterium]|nr:thiolase family protein [Thermoflexales bacterium]